MNINQEALHRAELMQASREEFGVSSEFTELSLAERYQREFGDHWRYVAAWGRWLKWSGSHWVVDDTRQAFDNARKVCKSAASALPSEMAKRFARAQTVAAVERLAQAVRAFASTADQWDTDRWKLNTPSGEVDLRTGRLSPNYPSSYCTKLTAVAPGGECKRWLTFLEEVTAGDHEMVGYLKKIVGMMLTGDVTEHALFFVWGPGGNGKSVFLNTIESILGSYSCRAPMEAFTESKSERHPTELAGLRGARMVSAIETEEGRRWAESKIKALTGGDPITARFMRQDFFTYRPQFKLIVVGNHKPTLRNVDDAMRRRLHMIPFTNRPRRVDRQLESKLQAELGGILSWAIDGCLEWQKTGLCQPKSVRQATKEYFDAEDSFGNWLSERIAPSVNAFEKTTVLFADWEIWADRNGSDRGDIKRFVANLEARGFSRSTYWKTVDGKRTKQKGFTGLGFR